MQDDINDFVLEPHIENVDLLTEEEYLRLNDLYPGRSREELLDLHQQLIGYFNVALKVYLRLKREGKWEAVAEELRDRTQQIATGKVPTEIVRAKSEPHVNVIAMKPKRSAKRPDETGRKDQSLRSEQLTLF